MAATITDLIKQDLQSRIEANRPLPTKLTLMDLAAHYRVSLTPVRLAINALIAENVLLRLDNGRLQINPTTGHLGKAQELQEELFLSPGQPGWEALLAKEVVIRSLRGDAEYLREEAMARRYGIGRTMIRQRFSRLAGQGIIEHIPRCGWRVRCFDEKDMSAYLIAREAMELAAMELARPHLVAADLQRMLEGNTPVSPGDCPRLDNHLHRYLIEKSGNRYIQDFFDRHGVYYTMLFDFAAPEAHVVSEMAEQHREILKALLADDWPHAREALARHIRAQHPVVQRLMAQIAGEASSQAKDEIAR